MENNHEYEIDLREYISILWRKKWVIIGLFIIAVVGTYFFVNTMDPVYKTSATIMIQKNDGMQNLFSGDMFSLGNDQSGTYIKMLKTRRILDQVIQKMDLRDEEGEFISSSTLGSMIIVSSVSGADMIEISMEHTEPEKVKKIVNTLVEVFVEENTKISKTAMTSAIDFIEKQVVEFKKELENTEMDLLNYKQENNIILPTEEAKQTLEKLVEAESSKSLAEVELKSIDASIHAIQREMAAQEERVISNTVFSKNPLLKQYKGQLTELESQLVGLKSKYTVNHPDVLSLESQIASIIETLKKEVEQEVSSQTESINPIYQSLYQSFIELETNRLSSFAKLESLDRIIKENEIKLQDLPEKELELVRLERVAKVAGEIYMMLITRLEEVKISEAMLTSDVYMFDSAYLPVDPIKPNKKMLILMAGFLAIFVGIGLTFLMEYLDTTVKTAEEVERLLEVPVIGSIPNMEKIK
ncbi:MAG: hypothetical protein KAX49_02340 [Halanaerobiales bacterium]|nr:hypothetical protein [Halanaerobiales bacterium]